MGVVTTIYAMEGGFEAVLDDVMARADGVRRVRRTRRAWRAASTGGFPR